MDPIIDRAAAIGISLSPDDFGPDNTIDGMDANEWLDAMGLD